jgi:hypothetical protein
MQLFLSPVRVLGEQPNVGGAAHKSNLGGEVNRTTRGWREFDQGFTCARISPGLCAALWTFTYRLPALKLAYWSSVSLEPAGTDHTPSAPLLSVG